MMHLDCARDGRALERGWDGMPCMPSRGHDAQTHISAPLQAKQNHVTDRKVHLATLIIAAINLSITAASKQVGRGASGAAACLGCEGSPSSIFVGPGSPGGPPHPGETPAPAHQSAAQPPSLPHASPIPAPAAPAAPAPTQDLDAATKLAHIFVPYLCLQGFHTLLVFRGGAWFERHRSALQL